MRVSTDSCPICGNPIKPLDSMRNLEFHGRMEKLHNRCWYENQDLLALLEVHDRELNMEEAVRRSRESDPFAS